MACIGVTLRPPFAEGKGSHGNHFTNVTPLDAPSCAYTSDSFAEDFQQTLAQFLLQVEDKVKYAHRRLSSTNQASVLEGNSWDHLAVAVPRVFAHKHRSVIAAILEKTSFPNTSILNETTAIALYHHNQSISPAAADTFSLSASITLVIQKLPEFLEAAVVSIRERTIAVLSVGFASNSITEAIRRCLASNPQPTVLTQIVAVGEYSSAELDNIRGITNVHITHLTDAKSVIARGALIFATTSNWNVIETSGISWDLKILESDSSLLSLPEKQLLPIQISFRIPLKSQQNLRITLEQSHRIDGTQFQHHSHFAIETPSTAPASISVQANISWNGVLTFSTDSNSGITIRDLSCLNQCPLITQVQQITDFLFEIRAMEWAHTQSDLKTLCFQVLTTSKDTTTREASTVFLAQKFRSFLEELNLITPEEEVDMKRIVKRAELREHLDDDSFHTIQKIFQQNRLLSDTWISLTKPKPLNDRFPCATKSPLTQFYRRNLYFEELSLTHKFDEWNLALCKQWWCPCQSENQRNYFLTSTTPTEHSEAAMKHHTYVNYPIREDLKEMLYRNGLTIHRILHAFVKPNFELNLTICEMLFEMGLKNHDIRDEIYFQILAHVISYGGSTSSNFDATTATTAATAVWGLLCLVSRKFPPRDSNPKPNTTKYLGPFLVRILETWNTDKDLSPRVKPFITFVLTQFELWGFRQRKYAFQLAHLQRLKIIPRPVSSQKWFVPSNVKVDTPDRSFVNVPVLLNLDKWEVVVNQIAMAFQIPEDLKPFLQLYTDTQELIIQSNLIEQGNVTAHLRVTNIRELIAGDKPKLGRLQRFVFEQLRNDFLSSNRIWEDEPLLTLGGILCHIDFQESSQDVVEAIVLRSLRQILPRNVLTGKRSILEWGERIIAKCEGDEFRFIEVFLNCGE